MPVVRVETPIDAPPEVCFDLARDARAHVRSAAATAERIVGPVPTDLLTLGDEVTFEASHLGWRWRLTSRITRFDSPNLFVDEQIRGPFRTLAHTHEFRPAGGDSRATLMVDTLAYESPLGALGRLADRLFLQRHLRRFLTERTGFLKREAERAAAGDPAAVTLTLDGNTA